MRAVFLYIEHPVMELNNTFTYLLKTDDFLARGMRVKVDFNGRKIIGFVDHTEEITDLSQYESRIGFALKEIDEIVDRQPLINDELYELGLWMSRQTVSPVISCFQAMLPAALKPSSSKASIAREKWVIIRDESIREQLQSDKMPLAQFKTIFSEYRYRKMRENGTVEVVEKEKRADVDSMKIMDDPFELTDQQKEAIECIEGSDKRVVLLHGLTGSGKTEIYLQLVKKAVLQGRQALVLVPEISLTPQMVRRFSQRFNNSIAIYHSGLSATEKYQQYQLVKQNKVKIVVGTRSAVFMPFADLGIIIMDEEHDNSYKQDNKPKYNTRDVALYRAQKHDCKLILGSATPTLESYARAVKGVYQLVSLTRRVQQELPQSLLVDMNQEIRKGNFIISSQLQQAIEKRLDNNQQVILLLNRRGYTPIMKCSYCGHVVTCPHCDIAMSYHKDEDRLVCHSCGYSQSADMECPQCGRKRWRNYGVATQRLAEEVERLFPKARVVRMDADSTRAKDSHQKILSAFEKHEYDVLVGTQMISKGLDFPDVTLVGIFNADGPLNRTDYRSVEMTFDLIVQASGRSGRSDKKGEVYIQAYDTSHYGIRMAVSQNYITFFNREMQYRHAGNYPPYCYMAAILFSGLDQQVVEDGAYQASDYFRNDEQIRTLGPSKLLKKKDEYRYRIIIKSTDKQKMIDIIWKWYETVTVNRQKMSVTVDVDPYILD